MNQRLSFYQNLIKWEALVHKQRGNRGSQAVRAESARIGARGIRADSADLAADRGNAAEVSFAVPKLIKLFVVKFI